MNKEKSATILLECQQLEVTIASTRVCSQLDFAIEPGQCWCILGRNGTGKTTLLHTLAGLQTARRGRIQLNGQFIDQLSRKQIARQLGVLFQDHQDQFPATVLETALLGRHPYLRPWQQESASDYLQARNALEFVGLTKFADRNVQTLSGGERRRTGIATLLTQNPALMLLDEPTNHLDLHHRYNLLTKLVHHAKNNNQGLCLVLHDINLAARFADRLILLLGDGDTRVGNHDEILRTPILEALYGHRLQAFETLAGPAWLPV